jgi:hypothetical protein
MPSVFAIVSKKVFEKEAAGLGPGEVWKTDAYLSTHARLSPLEDGGRLYLVTVRPPEEKLWLVGILDSPKKKKDGWHGATNACPITDISSLRSKIVFSTGKGMSQKKGALGMSLQTPRELDPADEQLLQTALGRKKKSAKKKPAKKAAKKKPADGPIRYLEEAKKYLSPQSADEVPQPKSSKALWKAMHDNFHSPTNLEESVPELAPVMQAFGASEEPEEIDVQGWAPMLARLMAFGANHSVGFLVSRLGPVEALKILVRAHDYSRTRRRPMTVVPASDEQPPSPLVQDAIHHALMRSDDATREQAFQIAEEAYEGAGFPLRLTLLSCFPDQTGWANALAREWLARPNPPKHGRDLLLGTCTDPEMIEEIVEKAGLSSVIIEVVPLLGVDAVPLLGRLLSTKRFPNEQKAIARALGCIGTPESANVFAKHLRKKHVRPYATQFYASYPELAEGALGELAKKRTKVGATAREILERVERSRSLARRDDAEVADDEAVPEILRQPPWHASSRPKRKKAKPMEGLVVPREPTRLHWPLEARRRHMAKAIHHYFRRRSTADARAELQAKIDADEPFFVQVDHPADLLFPLVESKPGMARLATGSAEKLLALHGDRALDVVLRLFEEDQVRGSLETLLRIESPRLAACLLKQLASPHSQQTAILWIERHPKTAVLGLVPATLGAEKADRRGGEMGLRYLARIGEEAHIRETAESHGPAAAKAIDAILGWGERLDCPKKPPKMPKTFRPGELRPPRLKEGGKALPEWAVARLGEMLSFSPTHPRYVGIEEIREACEPRSLAEHAWDLAQAWDTDGGKESHRWMLHAVEHFGDDEVVRRLTPALGSEGIARMLGRINTDAAIMELATIIARVEGKSTPKYAYGMHDALSKASALRGLEPFELEEELVPTFDVDEEGGLDLDFGPRSFRVELDAGLRPVLKDEKGERVKTLSRGAKDDDPEKVKAAHVLWTDLQEDVAVIAKRRGAGAAFAMQCGRRWPIETFTRVYLDHPLMKHLSRGIVWEARGEDGELVSTFRVAEDGTFADVHDDELDLGDDVAFIGVAHPFAMSTEERQAWRQVFEDYEVIQPFDQVGMDPPTLTREELSSAALTAKVERLDYGRLQAFRAQRGWLGGNAPTSRLFPDGSFGLFTHDHRTGEAVAQALDPNGEPRHLSEVDDVIRGELALIVRVATGEI